MKKKAGRSPMLKRVMALLLLFLSAHVYAADEKHSEMVIFPAGSIHQGDYFAFGKGIEISGTINGDLYVLGSQVYIDGNIRGDVLAIGGSIELSGDVSGNVRMLAGQGLISGTVGRNLTLIGGNIQLISSAAVGGNIVCAAGNADIASAVGGDVTLAASNFRLSSAISKNVTGYVGQMRITSKARIGGNVDYSSSSQAYIDPEAKITGTIEHHPSLVSELVNGKLMQGLLVGSKVAAILMNFIYTFVVGCVLLRLYPKSIEHALHGLSHKPWKALSFGVMLLILLPLASLLLLMTILGAPFALTLLALNVIGFYTAKVVPILWVSNIFCPKIGLKPNKIPSFFCGLVLYFVLAAIPFFGTIVALAAMLLGLGAGALTQTNRKQLK
jgi:cytoskeletal protein CcmA (bactofilin family)